MNGEFKIIDREQKVHFQYYKNGKHDEAETAYLRGKRFENGNGVLQDYIKAFENFEKAVHLQHKKSMLEVAKLYNERKINVNLSNIEKIVNYINNGKTELRKGNINAHMWANLSGNKEYRDNIKLTPDEVLEAQELAKICLKKKYKGCDN